LKKAWTITIISIFAGIAFALTMLKVAPTMGYIMGDYGINATQAGMLMTALGITSMIVSLPGGVIMQKIGPYAMAIVAILIAIAGNLVGIYTNSYNALLISRFIEGIGYGAVGLVVPAIIAAWFPAEKRGLPMAIWSLWVSIGMYVILNAANIITPKYGWKGNWWFVTITFVVVLIAFTLVVRMPKDIAGTLEGEPRQKPSISQGLKAPCAWCLGLAFLVFGFVNNVYTTFYPTFLSQQLGMTPEAANSANSAASVAMMVSGVLVGILLNRIPNKKHSGLLIIAMTAATAVCLIMFNLQTVTFVIPFVIILGIVFQWIPPVIFSVAPEASATPETMSISMGIIMMLMCIGGFTGSLIAGIFVDSYGWASVTIPCGVLAILGIASSIALKILMAKKYASE
jgi:MFS family permease